VITETHTATTNARSRRALRRLLQADRPHQCTDPAAGPSAG